MKSHKWYSAKPKGSFYALQVSKVNVSAYNIYMQHCFARNSPQLIIEQSMYMTCISFILILAQ